MSERDATTVNYRPRFLYRFYQFIAFAGAIPFVINTADVLLHPLATSLSGTSGTRIVYGLVVAPLTVLLALLCIRRVPGNLVGWMLVAFGYGVSVRALRLGLLPLAPTLFLANLFITLFWSSYILIPIYFPNGQLYPPRLNRWGNPLLSAIVMLLFFGTLPFNDTISWGTGSGELSVANPLFIVEFDYTVITIPVILSLLIAGAVTLILRYRGSGGQERLQLRWLLAGVFGQFGLFILSIGLAEALNVDSTLLGALYTTIIPVTIAVALLRYRLYGIDIIIRKTLQYAVLSALLALVYFGSVVLLQTLFGAAVEDSPLLIVLSTLLIAALFSTLRRRVQRFIDRRFYRSKYDAARTLAEFAQHARDEVELEALTGEVARVVQETLQPEQVSVWLRQPADILGAREVKL